MLKELAGLAKKPTTLYLETLTEYEKIIQGKILQPGNVLMIEEGKQLRPLDFQKSLLSLPSSKNLLNNLKNYNKADLLFSVETQNNKHNYAPKMETAREQLLIESGLARESVKSITDEFNDWFRHFNEEIQSCFIHLFKIKSNFSVRELPHVSAYLGYFLTRIYERNTFNIKDKDNDFFDQLYFTDAAVVDFLVTDDKSFKRTALRVPNRTFDIININELTQFIEKQKVI